MSPNIETVIGLKPDLVLVSTASQLEAFSKQLDQHGIPVYISDPRNLEGVFVSVQKIGDLLDERERSNAVAGSLRARTTSVEEKLKGIKPVTVFYQVSAEPLYTAGRDSFITDLIKSAGGASVTADVPGAWPRFSTEAALAAQPEAIVIPSGDSMTTGGNQQVAEALKRSPAFVARRVYEINGDLLSRPGPRLVDGLESMARDLHPEAFK
jgi:iron complex transport system substrate-binding protein